MDYVNLDRLFIPLTDDETATEWGPTWGQKYGGWLNWDSILACKRVALLAEALSGKTTELQERVNLLRRQGKRAFFVTVEVLAEEGFEAALYEEDVQVFQTWKNEESAEAWFFLDSVDEARLNGKKLTVALRKFSKELTQANIGRANVLITCRASDWKGKADREAVQQALPFVSPPSVAPEVVDKDADFLNPLFNQQPTSRHTRDDSEKSSPSDLVVVQLAPLSDAQKLMMATAGQVPDPEGFIDAIRRHGLDTMTERPGDLSDVLEYWKLHHKFGSLVEMTEEGIARKLRETDRFRADLAHISDEKARQGAEQLAAALVLAKTFTLRGPGHDDDVLKLKGCVDPEKVLSDWDQRDVNALVRRGLFAPATYGRIRFHHRTSQEYLAACWLQRLLVDGCPLPEIRRLLFVERYGVKTVVPALRAVAAWLAQWQPAIRDEIIRREPVTLIVHGDPRSLPIVARASLLASYAALHAEGKLDSERIDHHAAWMFSSLDLADALRAAWNANERENFRIELLSFIEEGKVASCSDLARATTLDNKAPDHFRVAAAKAMLACNDTQGLQALADMAVAQATGLSARLAPQLALVLFPRFLTVEALLHIMGKSVRARPFKSEGFDTYLAQLHLNAGDRSQQRQLAAGLAELCLQQNEDDADGDGNGDGDAPYVPKARLKLGKELADFAFAELKGTPIGDTDPGLVRLLMAAERCDRENGHGESRLALVSRIREDWQLNRSLMWADCTYRAQAMDPEKLPTRPWHIGPHMGHILWATSLSDVDWLAQDAQEQATQQNRQVAFSGLLDVLIRTEQLEARRALVDEIASKDPVLQADLISETAPPAQSKSDIADREYTKRHKEKVAAGRQSWLDSRDDWMAAPALLSDPKELEVWRPGQARLYDATTWIKNKARELGLEGARHWRLLIGATSAEVAEHYAAGMCKVWRLIEPARSVDQGGGCFSTKKYSHLAVDAITLDSADAAWESQLSGADADLAIRHAFCTGNSRLDWVERLMASHPTSTLPRFEEEIELEWGSDGARNDVLNLAAHGDVAARTLTQNVFALFQASEPSNDLIFGQAIKILTLGLDHVQREVLEPLVRERLMQHLADGNDRRAKDYCGLYGALNPDAMAEVAVELLAIMPGESTEAHTARQRDWIGSLFAGFGHAGTSVPAISNMSARHIAQLLKVSYQCTQGIEEDIEDRSAASDAKSTLFNALANKPGPEAFYAMRDLADDPAVAVNALRLKEVTHSKAETDGDLVAWDPAEVQRFGQKFLAPAKNGPALWELVKSQLAAITSDFENADATSRSLLELAPKESHVQTWLAEQLHMRALGRYHTHREPEVADINEPDIVVSSSSAMVEVAIEVKHCNMRWTVSDLEIALREQLARDYLRPANRRHGVLVITLHEYREWNPQPGVVWKFQELIAHLSAIALSLETNQSGPIGVSIYGIDATARVKAPRRRGKTKTAPAVGAARAGNSTT